jgi:hypothetical protein
MVNRQKFKSTLQYTKLIRCGPAIGDTAKIPVMRIRIRMFLGLLDPHPDPLVTSTDPDHGSPFSKQNCKKTLDFYCFVTSL